MGLMSAQGSYNTTGFYNIFDDDTIVNVLGMNVETFKSIRTFNYSISQKIMAHLNISQDELQNN